MKVAIYCRVSTEEQNVENQVSICKKFCESKSWEVFKIYTDVISGAKSSRPAFNDLLADMRNYKFRIVMVTKIDRLGRSLQHLISLLDEFKSKNVEFVATTQNIDTTSAAGRLQWQIMGAFAEFERELIRERTREGLYVNGKLKENVGKRGKDKKERKKRGGLRKANF